MKKGNSIKLKIAVIISIIITIFWLLPYIYVICCSFKPGSEVIAVPPSFLPKSFSVENFFLNYICLFDYLFISSQMSAKPYFIGSTGILLLW